MGNRLVCGDEMDRTGIGAGSRYRADRRGTGAGRPEFILVETGNTLWKKARRGELSDEQAAQGLGLIGRTVQRFIPDKALADRALSIARSIDHPVYDCLYLACAEREDGVVVTSDNRLIDKLSAQFGARLHLLGAP